MNIIDKNCNAIYYAQGSSRIHNLESIATSALDNHGLVRGVPEITLSASTGVGGDGRATRARVNLGPRGTEVVDGTSTVVKLFSKSEKRKVTQRLINMKKLKDRRNKGATMQKTDTRSYVTKAA